jgi:hypothetical protein
VRDKMLLAEKCQEEKVLTWADFQPHRLVSLWDMFYIGAAPFIMVLTKPAGNSGMLQVRNRAESGGKHIRLPTTWHPTQF